MAEIFWYGQVNRREGTAKAQQRRSKGAEEAQKRRRKYDVNGTSIGRKQGGTLCGLIMLLVRLLNSFRVGQR